MVQLKYGSDGLMSHCFHDDGDKPAIVFLFFSPSNSSLKSAHKTEVLINAAGLQGRQDLTEVSS